MKLTRLFLAALFTISIAAPAASRELRVYEHPTLEFRFTAQQGFERQPRPEDDLIYEVADPATGIHVVLWFTSTEQDGERYLKKMADMKGLGVQREPVARRIHGLDAWAFEAPATFRGKPGFSLLAVLPCGKSTRHPKENHLYIAEIWTPAERYRVNARTMHEILESVKVLTRIAYHEAEYPLYPKKLSHPPALPSPFVADCGTEIVVAGTKDGKYALYPMTVENGTPNDYPGRQWGKGRQLAVDAEDFPTLAVTGLHSETELQRETITGRPVAEIDAEARPEQSSWVGFLAHDEDLLSVIRGDNRLVARLALTHPQLARPLFNVFNVTLRGVKAYKRGRGPWQEVDYLLWNGRRIQIRNHGAKGWQQSIFNDEVLGYFQLDMWRELDDEEERYLREHYGSLDDARLNHLKSMLSQVNTGEMAPFYIQRYGFYEGHTGYRADPISIASVFGLLSIPEIDAALDGELYRVLTRHYTAER